MRLNPGPSRGRMLTAPVAIALLVAFAFYASGAALVSHHTLAHTQGPQDSAHNACAGHTHDSTTPDAPKPSDSEPCTLCDMLTGSGQEMVLTTPSTVPQTTDLGVDALTELAGADARHLLLCNSKRGPPTRV